MVNSNTEDDVNGFVDVLESARTSFLALVAARVAIEAESEDQSAAQAAFTTERALRTAAERETSTAVVEKETAVSEKEGEVYEKEAAWAEKEAPFVEKYSVEDILKVRVKAVKTAEEAQEVTTRTATDAMAA